MQKHLFEGSIYNFRAHELLSAFKGMGAQIADGYMVLLMEPESKDARKQCLYIHKNGNCGCADI